MEAFVDHELKFGLRGWRCLLIFKTDIVAKCSAMPTNKGGVGTHAINLAASLLTQKRKWLLWFGSARLLLDGEVLLLKLSLKYCLWVLGRLILKLHTKFGAVVMITAGNEIGGADMDFVDVGIGRSNRSSLLPFPNLYDLYIMIAPPTYLYP